MRIVHLIDADGDTGPPEGAAAAIALLQREDSRNEHLLICFGGVEASERLRPFGARPDGRISTTVRQVSAARQAIRREIARLGRIDLAQPWTRATAALAQGLTDLAWPLPSPPPDPPIDQRLIGPDARASWRDRFEIGDDELAVMLLDLDPDRSSAGEFGLTIAPLTCSIQDRTLVGLIPGSASAQGVTRAARYAASAADVWRIECLSAPMYAIAIASDAICCPTGFPPNDPWASSSSQALALRCALRMRIPVIAGSFNAGAAAAPRVEGAVVPRRAGRVGIVTALNESLSGAGRSVDDEASAPGTGAEAQRWLDRWRSAVGRPSTA
ncbi:MAG: hypothetical protein H6814_04075 [Phycisphaeraceae bacterium]|nr:hypothetical protein [Phycisphaeraceae bacterium]